MNNSNNQDVFYEVSDYPSLKSMMNYIGVKTDPQYPSWMRKVLNPELEGGGREHDKLLIWIHNQQKSGKFEGHKIFKYLTDMNTLKDCLNLQDGCAIQKLGVELFRKLFGRGKALFLWQSVVQNCNEDFFVPYICVYDEEIVLDWNWLGNYWSLDEPALLFGKTSLS